MPMRYRLLKQLSRLLYYLGYRPYFRLPVLKGRQNRLDYKLVRQLTWLELKYWDILQTLSIRLDSYIRHNKPPLWGRWGILG